VKLTLPNILANLQLSGQFWIWIAYWSP